MKRLLICIAAISLFVAYGCRKGDSVESKGFGGTYAVVMSAPYDGAVVTPVLAGNKITGTAVVNGVDYTIPAGRVERSGTVGWRIEDADGNRIRFRGRAVVADDGSVTAVGDYDDNQGVCGVWTATKE